MQGSTAARDTRSSHCCVCIVVLLLGSYILSTRGQECLSNVAVADASMEPAAVEVQQSIAGLELSDLPATRPNQPWPYKALSTAKRAPVPTTNANGVTYATLTHAPLANVTVAMLVWWFNQDLEKEATYVDGNKYSMYLMWHPRDHCHQIVKKQAPPAGPVNDDWLLQEFFLASKNFTRTNSAGFDAKSEAQTNMQLKVLRVNNTGMTLALQGPTGGNWVMLTHTWRNSKQAGGAQVTSQFWIGNPTFLAAFNRIINCGFSRGDDPVKVARKWQTHAVEEFGNFERILPGLYAARNTL